MDCLIHLMALCVFDPSGVYVTGELYSVTSDHKYEGFWCGHQNRFCRGPIGELKVGAMMPMTDSIVLDYGVKHMSFVMENDTGYEGVYLSLTWRPFR